MNPMNKHRHTKIKKTKYIVGGVIRPCISKMLNVQESKNMAALTQ